MLTFTHSHNNIPLKNQKFEDILIEDLDFKNFSK
jgi:hypothetical protein